MLLLLFSFLWNSAFDKGFYSFTFARILPEKFAFLFRFLYLHFSLYFAVSLNNQQRMPHFNPNQSALVHSLHPSQPQSSPIPASPSSPAPSSPAAAAAIILPSQIPATVTTQPIMGNTLPSLNADQLQQHYEFQQHQQRQLHFLQYKRAMEIRLNQLNANANQTAFYQKLEAAKQFSAAGVAAAAAAAAATAAASVPHTNEWSQDIMDIYQGQQEAPQENNNEWMDWSRLPLYHLPNRYFASPNHNSPISEPVTPAFFINNYPFANYQDFGE